MSSSVAAKPVFIDTERPIRMGILFVGVGFFGFLVWAFFAPLTSAAVAPGVVVADSRNKAIQHLEGGIIREVLVREGDRVAAGQVLARLDSATAQANLGRLSGARFAALAQEARLIAERDDLTHIEFPKELMAAANTPEVAEAIKGQTALFKTKHEADESERAIIGQRIAQYEEEIKGLQAQVESEDTQLTLIDDELEDVRTLVRKGLERKPRLLQLERTAADLGGQRGAHLAQIARTHQSIAEMQQQLVKLKAKRLDDAVSDLRDVQTKLADFNEQIFAAADTSRRLEVRAPVSGKVVSVFHETPGGVLKPGETLMELVPDQDQLVIEAQVRPEDIDVVRPDAPVRVKLTAYNQRRTSSLKGEVERISPDRIVDQRTEKAHYLARVVVNLGKVASEEGLKLYPGMPAVVFIETGRQSLLDYLLRPLFAGMDRGMREQ